MHHRKTSKIRAGLPGGGAPTSVAFALDRPDGANAPIGRIPQCGQIVLDQFDHSGRRRGTALRIYHKVSGRNRDHSKKVKILLLVVHDENANRKPIRPQS